MHWHWWYLLIYPAGLVAAFLAVAAMLIFARWGPHYRLAVRLRERNRKGPL